MFSLSTNLLITLHHQDLRLLYRYHPVLDHRGRPPALLPNHQWVASWILLKINVLVTETLTSLPYFEVKLSCVCLMFADKNK